MTASEILGTGACCTDCLILLANGETDPSWTEAETAEYLQRVERCSAGTEVTLGMLASEHSCQDASGQIADECDCEQLGFSWSACDVCGSNLGGDREAVTFWGLSHPAAGIHGPDSHSAGITCATCPPLQAEDVSS